MMIDNVVSEFSITIGDLDFPPDIRNPRELLNYDEEMRECVKIREI